MEPRGIPPKSPQHFHILDGLRGVAAIAVLIFHYVELIHAGKNGRNPIPHGYLAVDFFFCLSGFVIAHAYDNRINSIGAKGFFKNRLIRLQPMVVIGILAGLIAYIVDPATNIQWDKLSLATITGIFMIPVVALPKRFGCIFPLNGPAWSMFFEYFISIVYGLLFVRLKNTMLILVLCVSALMLGYATKEAGSMAIGWNFKTFSGGFPRVLFAFSAGLLIYRLNWKINNKFGILLPSLLLIAALVFPNSKNDWYIEVLVATLLLPTIVALGAGACASEKIVKWCKTLGELSYPIYMTHYATVVVFWSYVKANTQFSLGDRYLLAFACIVFNLIFAFFVLKVIDEPVRKWLNARKLKRG